MLCVPQTAAGISMSLRHKNEMQPTRQGYNVCLTDTHMKGEGVRWALFVSDGHPCKHCTFGLSKPATLANLFSGQPQVSMLGHTHTHSEMAKSNSIFALKCTKNDGNKTMKNRRASRRKSGKK